MLGIEPRAARAAWTISLVALLLYSVYSIRRTLIVFVLAVFFSYMLLPVVRWIERRAAGKISHTTATAAVFTILLVALAGLAALAGPAIAGQASALAERLPVLMRDSSFIDRIPLPDWLAPLRGRLAEFVKEHLESGTAAAVPLARQIGGTLLNVASNLLFVVLIPIIAFLFIKDASDLRMRYLEWAEERRDASMWRRLLEDLDKLLGSYIRALLLLALATLATYAVFLSIAGVPYGLLLAVIAGILEFIPVIGPVSAGVIVLTVAGVSGYSHLLVLLGFLVLYRLFQDYVLNPYLMSDGVSIPPLMVLFGILAGEELGGVVGIFLSVPVLAIARIAFLRVSQAIRKRERVAGIDTEQSAAEKSHQLPAGPPREAVLGEPALLRDV